MKILFLVIAILIGSISISLGQKTDTLSQKENLMKESQRMHKKGVTLLSAGAGGAIIGGALFGSNFSIFGYSSSEETLVAGTGGLLFLAGVGCMIASIHAFSKSNKIEKEAATLSFNTQSIYLAKDTNAGPKSFPSLKLTIPL